MKIVFGFCILFFIAPVVAKNHVLTWTAPTEFVDGLKIPTTATLTYRIYARLRGGAPALLRSETGLSTTVLNVTPGTWCYAITATIAGTESARSDEICAATIPQPQPQKPLPVKVDTTE